MPVSNTQLSLNGSQASYIYLALGDQHFFDDQHLDPCLKVHLFRWLAITHRKSPSR